MASITARIPNTIWFDSRFSPLSLCWKFRMLKNIKMFRKDKKRKKYLTQPEIKCFTKCFQRGVLGNHCLIFFCRSVAFSDCGNFHLYTRYVELTILQLNLQTLQNSYFA